MGGEIQGVQILLRPFVHHFRCRWFQGLFPGNGSILSISDFIKGRHIDSLDPGDPPQEPQPAAGLAFPFPVSVQQGHFLDDPLSISQHAEVQEICQRFTVEHAAASGTYKGIIQCPVLGQERDTAQIQHVEDVGVGHFIKKGEAQQVEFLQGPGIFQAGEHQAPFPHLLFHIHPGSKGPFRCHAGQLVEDFIEDLVAQVAHPDFVGVWKGQAEGHFRFTFRLDDAAELHAGVAGRFFYSTEYIDG